MAMPVGAKRAASQAVAWIVAGSCTAFSVTYFAEIKQFARGFIGLPKFEDAQQAGSRQAGDRTLQAGDRTEAPRSGLSGRTVELRASAYGHYHADAEINGRRVQVMVDTGATHVALTYEDASRAGIFVRDSDFTQAVRTANGLARVAPIMLDRVSIGDIAVRNVPASVSERGRLGTTLLGMSFLKRLNRVEMRGGTLLLQE